MSAVDVNISMDFQVICDMVIGEVLGVASISEFHLTPRGNHPILQWIHLLRALLDVGVCMTGSTSMVESKRDSNIYNNKIVWFP